MPLERLSYLPSPHGFEGTTSFLATGYLSDIRLRIEEILAELEPWQIMYERLVEFHREENDWPSVTEGKLGLWCNTQRIAYKRGCLAKERCDQLDAIGFEWNQLDSKWMREYHALKVFFIPADAGPNVKTARLRPGVIPSGKDGRMDV